MTSKQKSFAELLDEAPPRAEADTISVVGVLSRAADPEKFVITTADGRALTLDQKAVKTHAELANSIGQRIVRVDLDYKQLPADMLEVVGESSARTILTVPQYDPGGGFTLMAWDTSHTYGHIDLVPPQSDPAAPFVAAFQHQAASAATAAYSSITHATAFGFNQYRTDPGPYPKVRLDPPYPY